MTTTISDDDSVPADITLSIAGPAGNVAEGTDATFSVTLSARASPRPSPCNGRRPRPPTPLSRPIWASPPARSPSLQARPPIQPGISSIRATDDLLSEGEETFTVTLGSVGGDLASQVSVKSGSRSATATISESDPITVNITGPSSVEEGEAGTYTVSLSPSGRDTDGQSDGGVRHEQRHRRSRV